MPPRSLPLRLISTGTLRGGPGWREISDILRHDADAAMMALRTAKPEEYEAERAKSAVAELVTEIGRQAERFALQGVKFIQEKRERPKAARAFNDHDDANGARLRAMMPWLNKGNKLVDKSRN